MRVLAIINSLGRGGAEIALLRLAAAARPLGVEVVVLPLLDRARSTDEHAGSGQEIDVLPAGLLSLARAWSARKRWDVVEGWMYGGAVAATLFRLRGVPVAWNLRHVPTDLSLESRNTRLALAALKRLGPPARIHVNSTAAITAHRALGLEGDYRAIVNGIDTERFRACEDARRAERARLGVGADDVLLLHAARFHPHKGHAALFAAFARLATKRPDAHLLCVGDGTPEIERCARTAGVEQNRIRVLPAASDLVPLYSACDVLVSPSLTESFPTVVAEAMSCSRACVATDVGDTARLVGDTGLVVRAGSADALESGLASALQWSPRERSERGARARGRIVEHYGRTKAATAYVDSVRELLAQGRS